MSDQKRPLYGGTGMLDAFMAISERKDEAEAQEKRASEIASKAGAELRARVAGLEAQLAAVEKERDKLKEENSRLWAEAGDSSAVQARKERDEATGALAAEHSALIRACRETVLLHQAAEALLAKLEDDGKIYEEAQGYDPILSARYRRLRNDVDTASPAADLAARHDAEVERRALASLAQRLRTAFCASLNTGGAECDRGLTDRKCDNCSTVDETYLALATPTPEKP